MRPRRLLALALVLVALAGSSCAPSAETHPAAKVVARVLELREQRSTDAAAYRPLFAEAGVASSLASDALEAAAATRSPIPPHAAPYVSEVTTAGAKVVVAWRSREDWRDWPAATVFELRRVEGGRWLIADALPLQEGSATPLPLADPAR